MSKGIISGFSGGFFLLCILLSLVFGYIVLRPFIFIFMIAFVLATLSHPAYSWILKRTKGRTSLSSLLTCFLIVITLIIPTLILITLLAQESIDLYHIIEQKVRSGIVDQPFLPKLLSIQKKYLPFFKIDLKEIAPGKDIAAMIGKISSYLVSYSASLLKNVASGAFKFFLMLFALYYFLKDGPVFLHWLMHISPLPSSYEKEIFNRFRNVSESAFFGTLLTAVAQGILGGIGFLIVGLPPVLWAVAMAFLSLIPMVGTAFVWLPASVYLLLAGKIVSGIFLIIWGVVVIGLADNLIRPLLMKGKVELPPLLVFFSILGGVSAFGLFGILLGPLAISLCIVFLQVYAKEAKETLDELSKK